MSFRTQPSWVRKWKSWPSYRSRPSFCFFPLVFSLITDDESRITPSDVSPFNKTFFWLPVPFVTIPCKSMNESPSLTEQLKLYSGGDQQIAEQVLRAVLPKLHEIAVRELRRERQVAPVSPTELINEVWLRSLRKGGWMINDREHFFAIAAIAMRRVLVDFARSRIAQRRGDGQTSLSFEEGSLKSQGPSGDPESVVQVGILMERLDQVDPAAARIVDMHYFAGFTLEEISEITGLTFRQVRHRWEKGRDWLKRRLSS